MTASKSGRKRLVLDVNESRRLLADERARYGPKIGKEEALRLRGDATKCMSGPETVRRGDDCALILRVSGHTQLRNENLDAMERASRRFLEKRGVNVVACLRMVCNGSSPEWFAALRRFTNDLKARDLNHAKLFAESPNRYARHPDYHSNFQPNLQATEAGLERLRQATKGFERATMIPPAATPREERSVETKRGQRVKNRPGGHPVVGRANFRARWLPFAQRWAALGLSSREIAECIEARFNRQISHIAVWKALQKAR